MDFTNSQRAQVLVQALPYIKKYTGKTVAVYERTQQGFEALNYEHIPRID